MTIVRAFKIRINFELAGETIVLNVTFEIGVQVAHAQHTGTLVDFSLE